MAVLAANPHVLNREIHHRDQQKQSSNGGNCLILMNNGVGISFSAFGNDSRKRGWRNVWSRNFKVGGFWTDSSRPTVVQMEPIKDCDQLDQILLQARELSHLIIIDWMAAWCRKCIYLKPKLEKLAAEYDPKIKFFYVDVNNVPQALVKHGNISKMPTIQLWKDGEMKEELIGGHKAWLVIDEVREMIQKYA